MPRTCTVCSHPDCGEINRVIIAGELSNRRIASQYNLVETSLRRHKAEHLPEALSKAQESQEVAQADKLLAHVRSLQAKALSILDKAEASGDLRTALAAIREARGNLELLAKLLGELDERTQVNLVQSPEWIRTRTILMKALWPYPEARVAVAEALVRVES